MPNHLGAMRTAFAFAVTTGMFGCSGAPQTGAVSARSVMDAEDARPTTVEGMQPILDGLAAADPAIRAVAVRALGRFERDDMLPRILPVLADPDPTVRTAAALATGMAVRRAGSPTAQEALNGRLQAERDPRVLGALAYTLGNLEYASAQAAQGVALQLAQLADTAQSQELILGVARGLESIFRPNGRTEGVPAGVVRALQALSQRGIGGPNQTDALVRRLAVSSLARVPASDPTALRAWMTDPDFQVRRLALANAVSLPAHEGRAFLTQGLRDAHFAVRYAALLALSGVPGAACENIRSLDPNLHVRLLAIDMMPTCEWATQVLDSMIGTLAGIGGWHEAAHGLVALSRRAPSRAAARIDAFVRHDNPFVRMYAARAAGVLADTTRLYQMASDRHHNVREVALRGLQELVGHQGDSVFLANLAATDYQLVMTAANALEGTSTPGAPDALGRALTRISAERRETSRDARIALLTRLAEIAPNDTSSLKPYLADFDPEIARKVASMLGERSGAPTDPVPNPLSRTPFPSESRLTALAQMRIVLQMADGGEITIRLRSGRAPTNAERFARLAENGYFNGLTFHRVVPNFVVQGGSPGANEYAGDGPYTRDEITGDPHLRGTVGLSTRGRDTGDGQIFINLVDNYRLDADYTLFGEVETGMDVVDQMQEGAVISRADVRIGPNR